MKRENPSSVKFDNSTKPKKRARCKSESDSVLSTAIQLHRELTKRGLDLRNDNGRDAGIIEELATKLGISKADFEGELEQSNLSAEHYLQAFMKVAEPFARMFQEIWAYLSNHNAPNATQSIKIRLGFNAVDGNHVEIDLEQFKKMSDMVSKELSRFTMNEETFSKCYACGREIVEQRIWQPSIRRYRLGENFELPKLWGATPPDRMLHRLRNLLQYWIIEANQSRDISSEGDELNGVEYTKRLRVWLSDLLPNWLKILENWDIESDRGKQLFSGRISKLLESINWGHKTVESFLMILELPFWRERWRTYEVWATIVAFDALSEYQLVPNNNRGTISFDATTTAQVATLEVGGNEVYAYVQAMIEAKVSPGRSKHIKPDLLFSLDAPPSSDGTLAIVEFKQRMKLSKKHLEKVFSAYSKGTRLGGGVIVINYDKAPYYQVPNGCRLLASVRPGSRDMVEQYRRALWESFTTRIVLLDTSSSMGKMYDVPFVKDAISKLLQATGIHTYQFNNDLATEVRVPIVTIGGSKIEVALRKIMALHNNTPIRLLVVTDGDYICEQDLKKKFESFKECCPNELKESVDWIRGS